MRPISTILDRFRRSAGVPATVGGELEAELLPVFAALDEIEAEAEQVRARAAQEAEARVAAARHEAARLLDVYRRRAETERLRAEAERLHRATAEARAVEEAGEAEAAAALARGRRRVAALAAEVVARLERGIA